MTDEEILKLVEDLCEQTIRDTHSFPAGDNMSGRKAMASIILKTIRNHKDERKN